MEQCGGTAAGASRAETVSREFSRIQNRRHARTPLGLGRPAEVILPLLALNLIRLLYSIAWLLMVIMAARLIMSLVNPAPYNPLVLIVYGLTEPLLAPLRGLFPRGPGGLDLRALFFLVVAVLIQQVVLRSLHVLVATWIGQSLSMGAFHAI